MNWLYFNNTFQPLLFKRSLSQFLITFICSIDSAKYRSILGYIIHHLLKWSGKKYQRNKTLRSPPPHPFQDHIWAQLHFIMLHFVGETDQTLQTNCREHGTWGEQGNVTTTLGSTGNSYSFPITINQAGYRAAWSKAGPTRLKIYDVHLGRIFLRSLYKVIS